MRNGIVGSGDDDILAELLLEWEEHWRRGTDVPAAELSAAHPHLAVELNRRINALKSTSWLDHPAEQDAKTASSSFPKADQSRILAGRYRLDALFAKGGFAEVWRAFDLELQRMVSIKLPKADRLNNADSFLAEARRAVRIRHPGIVPVYDVGWEQGACFIVSEFMEGGDLRLPIRQKPDPQRAIRWVAEVAEALDCAHQAGIIHRDIKPANILISRHGSALLADFGIARSPASTAEAPPWVGTLSYMSPEQLEGQEANARSDIYSLGVVLHELLTGRLPPAFDEPAALKAGNLAGATARGVPAGALAVVAKALHPDPKARYPSAAHMAADLKRCRNGLPGRWPVVGALACLPVVLGLAGTAWWLGKKPAETAKVSNLLDAWLTATAALPAGEQARAVAEKLRELNPGFDGVVHATIANGKVEGFEFITDHVSDISPVRALANLKTLACFGSLGSGPRGALVNLGPLAGMKLTRLDIRNNQKIRQMNILAGMPLTHLNCSRTGISDLNAVSGMRLNVLMCGWTKIPDLAALQGMPITILHCNSTMISDLSPLQGMQLDDLRCQSTRILSLETLRGVSIKALDCQKNKISEIEPLRGMTNLAVLDISMTSVTDFSPLKETLNLKVLKFSLPTGNNAGVLREVKSLERINDQPAAEFLKRQCN